MVFYSYASVVEWSITTDCKSVALGLRRFESFPTHNFIKFLILDELNYMGIIIWIVFGGFIGWMASRIMKSDLQHDVLLNIVVGIAGAIIGGWIMNMLGQEAITGVNFYSFIVALIGAVMLIGLLRIIRRSIANPDQPVFKK